jgi:hypothetical protein
MSSPMADAKASEAPADADESCAAKFGSAGTPMTFDEAYSSLPIVEPKGPYESSLDYEKRLATTQRRGGPLIVVSNQPIFRDVQTYDPDRRIFRLFTSVLGVGQLDLSSIFGRSTLKEDNFSSAVAFKAFELELSKDTYQTTNGFGAPVTVTRMKRQVGALWERPGKLGESPFPSYKRGKPLAELQIEPNGAQDIIDRGTVAYLIEPRAPYTAQGKSSTTPSFRYPFEVEQDIKVIVGDIQCVYLRRGDGGMVAAIAVR